MFGGAICSDLGTILSLMIHNKCISLVGESFAYIVWEGNMKHQHLAYLPRGYVLDICRFGPLVPTTLVYYRRPALHSLYCLST